MLKHCYAMQSNANVHFLFALKGIKAGAGHEENFVKNATLNLFGTSLAFTEERAQTNNILHYILPGK